MAYTVSEDYRQKKMAFLVKDFNSVVDVGCVEKPNLFLKNPFVLGLDIRQSTLPDNYSKFFRGTIEELKKEGQTFDALIAGELIEHLPDPISFLRNCSDVIASEGVIVLSTPNPHSPIELLLNITLSKRFFCSNDHIMLFPQRWLIRMLEMSGFKKVKLYSGGFPIPFIGLIPFPRFCCYQTIATGIKAS